MRILHVSSWFQPKLGYSEFHLAKAHQRLGHEVAVLTSDRYYPFPDYDSTVGRLLGKRVIGVGERVEEGLLTFRLPVYFEWRHHLLLRNLDFWLNKFRPEVVHIHEALKLPVLQCALAKSNHKFRLVVASSMEKEVFHPLSFSRRIYYLAFKIIASPVLRRNVSVFTAVGAGAKEILENELGLVSKQVKIVPLGADSERFRPDASLRNALRERYGIPNEAIVIIYAGKLIAGKDVHVLVEAFTRLSSQKLVFLHLIGNGPEEYISRLNSLAGPLANRVIFSPPVPNTELAQYFCSADIGVWPSQSSNAAIEAMMCGLPIIVNDAPSVAHYISGENGLSFQLGDVAQLVMRLGQLVENDAERARLGANGRRYALVNLSWDAIAQKYLSLYHSSGVVRSALEE